MVAHNKLSAFQKEEIEDGSGEEPMNELTTIIPEKMWQHEEVLLIRCLAQRFTFHLDFLKNPCYMTNISSFIHKISLYYIAHSSTRILYQTTVIHDDYGNWEDQCIKWAELRARVWGRSSLEYRLPVARGWCGWGKGGGVTTDRLSSNYRN